VDRLKGVGADGRSIGESRATPGIYSSTPLSLVTRGVVARFAGMRLSRVLVLVLAACGGAKPAPAPASAAHSAADLGPLCRAHYAHEQTCADDYLSALIDLRVELNQPPGIADEVKIKGKPATLELARAEFQQDTAPAKVDAICNAMATKTPAAQVGPLFKDGTHCAEMTDCKQFASCAVATERTYIAGGGCHTDDCKAEH